MTAAWAHGTGDHAEYDFGWSFEPWAVLPILLAAVFYKYGYRRLAARGSADRCLPALMFWTGLGALALALMSPLHAYGTHVFAAHMVEHEILMVFAVPLIVASRPAPVLLWGMPAEWRAWLLGSLRHPLPLRIWQRATELGSATLLHIAVLWLWHVPALFEAAVAHESVHILQHLSFVISAIFFWEAIFDRDARRYQQGLAAVALFFVSLQAGLLGAILTFSTRLWYPHGPDPFPIAGVTRMEDQALAGLIMWVPACTIYVVAAIALLARWLTLAEARHANS